jgi:sec-independent protein translocase protein TatA
VLQHWPYLIVLGVIALIIFGPKRLPELGEGLGRAIREFRKATSDIGDSIREETHRPDAATGTTYTAPPVEPVAPAATAATPPPATTPAPEPPKS